MELRSKSEFPFVNSRHVHLLQLIKEQLFKVTPLFVDYSICYRLVEWNIYEIWNIRDAFPSLDLLQNKIDNGVCYLMLLWGFTCQREIICFVLTCGIVHLEHFEVGAQAKWDDELG